MTSLINLPTDYSLDEVQIEEIIGNLRETLDYERVKEMTKSFVIDFEPVIDYSDEEQVYDKIKNITSLINELVSNFSLPVTLYISPSRFQPEVQNIQARDRFFELAEAIKESNGSIQLPLYTDPDPVRIDDIITSKEVLSDLGVKIDYLFGIHHSFSNLSDRIQQIISNNLLDTNYQLSFYQLSPRDTEDQILTLHSNYLKVISSITTP
eukprot:CAMPEP_0197004908 /NCGR_PEP_ID=MMETSP1380-20130617/26403_1 /TAXON_ID=5936 /ORGANISM="Euplotes crassus, Strain CT5" /LENGTH=208 /DNA_ID=CAMNT_0042423859 /DNA_START=189 /DNA_END=812 /DNA_ORIENTATION=+